MAEQQNSQNHINPVQLERLLKGMDYPATKQDLLRHVEEQGRKGGETGIEHAKAALNQLPDQTFDSPIDVSQAVGDME